MQHFSHMKINGGKQTSTDDKIFSASRVWHVPHKTFNLSLDQVS